MISYLFYLNYFLIVPSKLKKCVRNHFKPLTPKGEKAKVLYKGDCVMLDCIYKQLFLLFPSESILD